MSVRVLPRLALAALIVLGVLPVAAVGVAHARTSLPPAASTGVTTASVRVVGTSLVDGGGRPLRMLGVNRAGTEYACAQGWGIFDGPTDAPAIAAMKAWNVGAVRVPLNEQCWLGINGAAPDVSGQRYRDAIKAYVARLNGDGLVVVLDLHWSAAGTARAVEQQVMANADHSPAFWSSVATTFRTTPGVVFDLFNEPHDISWSCWRNGCTTSAGWRAAGMQTLLEAVRAAGARQPVLVSGNGWGGDLSQWLANRPTDSAGQLAASAHVYSFSQCGTVTCWDSSIAPVARVVPVVTAELGEDQCTGDFVTRYMDWADAHGVSYLGWTWNTWDCRTGPALITSYDGTPTAFGRRVRDRFAALAGQPTTTPSPVPAAGGHLAYGFDVSWRGEVPDAEVRATSVAHSGGGGLVVRAPALTAGTAVVRVNSGPIGLDPSDGGLVSAWVKVPVDAVGTGWRAQLQLQDVAWTWRGGTDVTLVPGVGTQITYRPTTEVWAGNRSVGVQFLSTQTGTGPQVAYVDEVSQLP